MSLSHPASTRQGGGREEQPPGGHDPRGAGDTYEAGIRKGHRGYTPPGLRASPKIPLEENYWNRHRDSSLCLPHQLEISWQTMDSKPASWNDRLDPEKTSPDGRARTSGTARSDLPREVHGQTRLRRPEEVPPEQPDVHQEGAGRRHARATGQAASGIF